MNRSSGEKRMGSYFLMPTVSTYDDENTPKMDNGDVCPVL